MNGRLSNLRELSFPPEYKYKENLAKDTKKISHNHQRTVSKSAARIINECYQSDEYRKIRMTYYDAGETQVFNSLWYPRAELGVDIPLLGIDLIQFKNRYLVVVDFQPLQEGTQSIPEIQDVWERMPEVLRGRMSDRFYDEGRFFSNHMLFGRFGREKTLDGIVDVGGDLWDACEKYLSLHIDMVQESMKRKEGADLDQESIEVASFLTLERHQEYDTYSAARDPAHALFVRIFGKQFADGYVYDFLFSLSDSKVDDTQ
eukprot:CAMPEP_0204646292 /NCGR_PEP_ID=MMETSP0718-20130828/4315_1 /ASSEMBLY_ACC=CAM_ASM_000674 /TAXON_ID=230516 /ORGANISM="Chaetoceros curvisetus" /LENGTH=258 /DNA_ID=CAMNT_0051668497 /DNA_START=8 /DNA_END=784 /DNA_ORIENTATION=-